jgi:putative membrane protein
MRFSLTLALLATLLLLGACQSCNAAEGGLGGSGSSSATTPSISGTDKSAIKNMAESFQLLLAVLKPATRKEGGGVAANLATTVMKDFQPAWTELATLAQSKNVEIAADVARSDKRIVDGVGKTTAAKYDKELVDAAEKEMKKLDRAVQGAAKSASDADVKAWMEKTVPKTAGWLQAIEAAKKSLSEKKK